jgi:rRNA processing protein Gar1
MQNSNEHRIFIPTRNQYSNSDSANTDINETKQMECDIPQMVIPENKERQNISPRCGIDHISDNQICAVDSNQELTNLVTYSKQFEDDIDPGYTYSYMVDKLKRNPEDMIDQITFSEDEEDPNHAIPSKKDKMTTELHDNELKNICDLYEEDASMTKYTGTKNEIDERKEIPVPFPITPTDVLLEAGIIDDIINDKIMIKANSMIGTLDLDNIIFTFNKIPFGYIDDVIGKIDEPFYVVKYFPNINKISLNLNPGQSTFNVKEKSKYVEKNDSLRKDVTHLMLLMKKCQKMKWNFQMMKKKWREELK